MPRTATADRVDRASVLDFLRPRHKARQGKSLIRVGIERWGPIATGGFPPGLTS
jgi:hypothetical protein